MSQRHMIMRPKKILWLAFFCGLFLAAMLALISQPVLAVTAQDLIAPGATVERVANGFGFIEGPVWHRDGYLLFSDTPRAQVMKWHPTTGISVYRQPVTGTNGLTFDAQNRLLIAEQDGRQLVREELNGTLVTLASTYQGKKLNSPNDVALTADGSIYFTDPPYGLANGGTTGKELTFNGVFRLSTTGVLTLLTSEFDRPNGLAFSPNEKILYIADTSRNMVRAFDVLADGSITNSRLFANVNSPDGLKVDVNGNVWVATLNGVSVLDPTGQQITVIAVPEQPSNVGFGGSDLKTLYITARTGLYRIQLTVAGMPHYGIRTTNPNTVTPTRTATLGITNTPTRTATLGLTSTRTNTPVVSKTPTQTVGASPTRTITPTVGISPTGTMSSTPTRTSTPTNTFTPGLPITSTPTRTITPTATITPTSGAGACSPVTSTITTGFVFDGAGTFCWQASTLGTYINSWNTVSVSVNGTNYSNVWVAVSALPAKINGFWYIAYNSTVAWGHIEAK